MPWMTKTVKVGATHFVVGEGDRQRAVCSTVQFRDGPALAPFKSSFVPRDPFVHLCTMCRRVLRSFHNPASEEPCTCGKCGVRGRTVVLDEKAVEGDAKR